MGNMIEAALRLPRRKKRIFQLVADIMLIETSLVVSMAINGLFGAFVRAPSAYALNVLVTAISLVVFIKLGLYRAVLRYVGSRAIVTLFIGVATSTLVLDLLGRAIFFPLPAGVLFDYFLLSLLLTGGTRFALRSLYQHRLMKDKPRVLIYGAGSAGCKLVASLRQGSDYLPVAFVDDWRGMEGTHVEGLEVHSPRHIAELVERLNIEKILLAIPSARRRRRQEIVASLEPLNITIQTIPRLDDVVQGRAKIEDIRDVSVEELLGRDPVPPRQDLMDANIRDQVVMVTGAGGSIGSELCRQILAQRPRQLLLFDSCEYSLYQIEQELLGFLDSLSLAVELKPFLGTIQDQKRLRIILQGFKVDTIYHAAAYKHVPMVEHNMVESLKNNTFGTLAAARAAIDSGVSTFVLISSDKAVRPTNVMGTSKRLAELVCQALAEQSSTTRFCMVRFGNVLGSSGSVIPLFRRQIQQGGPVTVTHPEITRYFMTIPEAAQLVIQAGAMGQGGDVFVLDMGQPVKILDLARQMIRLSGLEPRTADNPHGEIDIVFTQLRPGEKLYEELLIGQNDQPSEHPRIMTANEGYWSWSQLAPYLEQLRSALDSAELERVRELLRLPPTGYSPTGGIADLVWRQHMAQPPSPTRRLAGAADPSPAPLALAAKPL